MVHNETNTDAGGEREEVKIRNRSANGSALMGDLSFGTGATTHLYHHDKR